MKASAVKRKRWNFVGFMASIILTFALLGLIIYCQEHKEQLEVVMSILIVILAVTFFVVIWQNAKRIIKNKLNKVRNE